MKDLKRQDRNGTRTSEELRRRYKFKDIELTADEVEYLKQFLEVDSFLSTSSTHAVENRVITQALNNKVNKEEGKGLSSNDFTDELLNNLNIAYNAAQTGGTGGVTGDTLPIGSVVEYPSDIVPLNWLLCNGQAVSRTEYSELFAILGTTWGEGDGNTTFNLPTKEGLVTVGKKSADTDFDKLGKTGGEKTHKLTRDELASHSHAVDVTTSTKEGTDNIGIQQRQSTSYTRNTIAECTTSHNYNGILLSGGGDKPHNNLQPYVTSNFIIKAKQSAGIVSNIIDNLNSTSATDALSANQGKVLNDSKLDTSSNLTNTEIETLINNIVL